MPGQCTRPRPQPTLDRTVKLCVQSCEPQHASPPGRDLDGQREAIDMAADSRDELCVFVGQMKVGVDTCGTLDEEFDCRHSAYCFRPSGCVGRYFERRHIENLFARTTEHLAACCEDFRTRRNMQDY